MRNPLRGLAALLLLLLGAAAPATAPAPAAPRPRASVAVLYFDPLSNDEDHRVLQKGLAQMLIADLVASAEGRFEVVERERLEDVLGELKLSHRAGFDQATSARIGRLVGAQYQVVGSFVEHGKGKLRLMARVLDVETGRVLHSSSSAGTSEDFLAMEQALAVDLAPFLATLVPPPPGRPAKAAASDPPAKAKAPVKLALETAVKYSKALDALDRKDPAAARVQLEKVVEEQPEFALAAKELSALMR